MKTPAIIVAFTIVGSIAFAAGQARVVPPNIDLQSQQSHGGRGGTSTPPQAMSLQGGDCNTAPLIWFLTTPKRLRACSGADGAGVLPLGAADVNGDGVIEHFDADYSPYSPYGTEGVKVAGVGGGIGGVLLALTTTEVLPSETVVWRNSVLSVGDLESVLEGMCGCNITWANLFAKGWRDCDHDGDLDLVASVRYQVWGISGTFNLEVWYENTGFGADPPALAADINEDGVVDGKDLASVLSAWTP